MDNAGSEHDDNEACEDAEGAGQVDRMLWDVTEMLPFYRINGTDAAKAEDVTEMPDMTVDEVAEDGGRDEEDNLEDDESSVEETSLRDVQGTWDQWDIIFGRIAEVNLNIRKDGKVRVSTLCSGTDAPVSALKDILGNRHVHHTFSCDKAEASRRFIMRNCQPDHMYCTVGQLLDERPHCLVCKQGCQGHLAYCQAGVRGCSYGCACVSVRGCTRLCVYVACSP